jgi:multidrug transporter EmrE-like cation transporter
MNSSLLAGALVYLVAVVICYFKPVRESALYFPIGLACGLAANYLWLAWSRSMTDPQRLVAGFYWDGMIVAMYALVPVLLFGVRVTAWTALGLVLIVVGVLLTKLEV